MIKLLLRMVSISLGALVFPVGVILMIGGSDDPYVVGRAMTTVILLCSIVWFVAREET